MKQWAKYTSDNLRQLNNPVLDETEMKIFIWSLFDWMSTFIASGCSTTTLTEEVSEKRHHTQDQTTGAISVFVNRPKIVEAQNNDIPGTDTAGKI